MIISIKLFCVKLKKLSLCDFFAELRHNQSYLYIFIQLPSALALPEVGFGASYVCACVRARARRMRMWNCSYLKLCIVALSSDDLLQTHMHIDAGSNCGLRNFIPNLVQRYFQSLEISGSLSKSRILFSIISHTCLMGFKSELISRCGSNLLVVHWVMLVVIE